MEAFHEGIYARVAEGLKVETIRLEVVRVIGGGESAWAAVESLCTATSKYGELENVGERKPALVFSGSYFFF